MSEAPPPSSGDALQFDAVVPRDGTQSTATCAQCKTPIVTTYWETGGHVLCESCKAALESVHGADARAGVTSMARALLFGAGAALTGAALYLAVLFFLHLEVGLIAILVGWMVGWAVRKGTRGRGGRRFQVLAVVLTYFAISVSYVPQMLMSRMEKERTHATADSTTANSIAAPADSAAAAPAAAAADSTAPRRTGTTILYFAVGLAFLLVVAPVKVIATTFPSSLISALIIGFGLLQAWRQPQRAVLQFRGPFRLKPPAPPPPAPPPAPQPPPAAPAA